MKVITRTIWLLSLVSLFTDISSEMLYPIMPVYLQSIHFSVVWIGVLEGFAEGVAGLSKGYFGAWSDKMGQRLPFVRFGYFLSAIAKPMLVLFTLPAWVFTARSMDRLGKGIRTGARDALLSAESTPETKGQVFGFHRGMDTLGAVLGPVLSLVILYFFPANYKLLFIVAFVPAITSVFFTFGVIEKPTSQGALKARPGFKQFFAFWANSSTGYRKLVGGLLLFALVNSSDMFLLLKVKESGLSDRMVVGVYVFYNLVYAISSHPLGKLGDKLGFKNVFVAGLVLFAIAYGGMTFSNSIIGYALIFIVYGMYAAATEGISKAWISNLVSREETATAIGTYTGFQSICTLVASSVAGILWYGYGNSALFGFTAVVTLCLAIYFYLFVIPAKTTGK